ncbi:sensor histidine kinase [Williamsia deligens]|uniref:Sensor-like histidine kinase SenX3 n=1 Tax=Williamsia deligens TaxID=321325 RepID=A0ABW3G477_9NOCA|nr:ATP-binding protein [Williamsia deligens]MCP2194423.1 two-component system, OmpR family, sensor histidine kinase SenX3 [Williamsia deligens]
MTVVLVVVVVLAVVLVAVAAMVGWTLGRRRSVAEGHRAALLRAASNLGPAAPRPDLADDVAGPAADEPVPAPVGTRPEVLLERGTETVDGRMSKAALLAMIVQSTDTGVAVVDEHRDVVLFNGRASSLGLVSGGLLDDEVWRAASTVLQSGDDCDVELVPTTPVNGFVSTARAVVPPVAVRCLIRLVTDGTERYAVVYGTDDSDNMRLEATRRDFVANVSHELKTPVGAIGLLTEALLEAQDDPEAVRHFGERVMTESVRMGNMVNELIALSRLQGAEKLHEIDDVSVDELIDEAVHRAQVGAEAAGIILDTDRPSGLFVRGDRTLLLTALNNLIANAVAYSPANTRVSVSRRVITDRTPVGTVPGITPTTPARPMVAIAVTDRGIGIAPRDQQRVFERFFRVDKARSRATGGTGLGLAIVKHVAANHDGTITLWSRPGTGSTFTLAIPQAQVTSSPDDASPAARTTGRPAGSRTHPPRMNPDNRVLETKE